eukprot:6506833-Prymnesium_polylepis.2
MTRGASPVACPAISASLSAHTRSGATPSAHPRALARSRSADATRNVRAGTLKWIHVPAARRSASRKRLRLRPARGAARADGRARRQQL